MKKIIFIFILLFICAFVYVWEQTNIYITAYQISQYNNVLAKIRAQKQEHLCSIMHQANLARLSRRLDNMQMSLGVRRSYINVAGKLKPEKPRTESFLAKIFNLNQAQAKP